MSKLNAASMVTLTQGRGVGPVLCIFVGTTTDTIKNFDADVGANVTCERTIILTYLLS